MKKVGPKETIFPDAGGEIEPELPDSGQSFSAIEPSRASIPTAMRGKASSSAAHADVGTNAALYGPANNADFVPEAPMRAWTKFTVDPSLANISKGYRAMGGAQRFALEEILTTFDNPDTDGGIRAAAEYHLGYFVHTDPAQVPNALRRSVDGVPAPERQQRALSQVLGWFTTMDAHRGLRLEAIEKLGWIGDAEAELILRQRIDEGSPEEREAAASAHERLIDRGVLPSHPPLKVRQQQKQALLELLDTFTDPVHDAALHESVERALARLGGIDEWPGRQARRAERTIPERQWVALNFLLLSLDDPWRDGDLLKAAAEKLGWVGDTYSARVLARAARMVPAAERRCMFDAIARIDQRGGLPRSQFVPELFEQNTVDEQLEWLFRNAEVVKMQPLGEARGANEAHLVLVSATSLAEGANYWALGIYKPASSYRDAGWQYGPAAYEVSKSLFRARRNPVPPTFETIINGMPGSVQVIASAEAAKDLVRADPRRLAKLSKSSNIAMQISDAMVYDRVIEDSDRFQSWGDTSTHNVGNYMFDPENALFLIDHDFTFGRGPHATFLPERYNPKTIKNLRAMRAEWSELAQRLALYLHPLQAERTRRAIEAVLADAES